MAFSYKGSISFGLVYIPVTLQRAAKEQTVNFNTLDKNTMSRIKYIKTCANCDGSPVEAGDIIRGYEYEKGKYVIFENDDFEKLKTQKDKNITIESFVDIAEIDPIYFDTPYYVVPNGGEKAFNLLVSAMEKAGKAGIAKTVLGTKETLIALRAKNGELLLNTLFFYDEITTNPAKEKLTAVNPKELQLAVMLIENMKDTFKPQDYKDEYRERLLEAITNKINGKEIVAPKEKKGAILDIMLALEESLKQTKSLKQNVRKPSGISKTKLPVSPPQITLLSKNNDSAASKHT